MTEDAGHSRRRPAVTIEDVMGALALRCDGAKTRDGQGFSRSDANEGGRLAGLRAAGMAWSLADARKAEEIVGKYAKQAGLHLGDGDERRQEGIEKAVRGGKVMLGHAPTDAQAPYNYAGLSPGGKRVYLWKMAWLADAKGLFADLRAAASMRHGSRRIEFTRNPSAEMTVNGERRRIERYEIDLNGTSQPLVTAICERHGFVAEPAIRSPIDPEIDAIRRHTHSAWIHRGSRYGERGEWAVFDLVRKDERFSTLVKSHLKGHYVCEPNDDWNWFVRLNETTRPTVRRIALALKVAVTRDFVRSTAAQAEIA